ncbi:MAG: helix-turn-helix domain-containing protein [Anaeromyxobacter sp.]
MPGAAHRSKTVASFLVRRALRLAEQAGLAPEAFLQAAGLTAAEVDDPAARIGQARYLESLAQLRAAGAGAAEPPAGARLEDAMPLLVGHWLNAPTLRAALAAFLKFRPLVDETGSVRLHVGARRIRVEHVAEGPLACAADQAAWTFSELVSVARAYDGAAPEQCRMELQGEPPRWLAARHPGRVTGGAPASVLELPRARLEVPFPHYNAAAAAVLARRLSLELAELERRECLSLRVERALRRAVPAEQHRGGAPERLLERLCAELGMTRWTLRRRLQEEEQVTFKALWARVKLEEARRLLEDTPLPLGEVGARLGFSTPTAFSRFFRQGAGVGPAAFRERCAGEEPGPA